MEGVRGGVVAGVKSSMLDTELVDEDGESCASIAAFLALARICARSTRETSSRMFPSILPIEREAFTTLTTTHLLHNAARSP